MELSVFFISARADNERYILLYCIHAHTITTSTIISIVRLLSPDLYPQSAVPVMQLSLLHVRRDKICAVVTFCGQCGVPLLQPTAARWIQEQITLQLQQWQKNQATTTFLFVFNPRGKEPALPQGGQNLGLSVDITRIRAYYSTYRCRRTGNLAPAGLDCLPRSSFAYPDLAKPREHTELCHKCREPTEHTMSSVPKTRHRFIEDITSIQYLILSAP